MRLRHRALFLDGYGPNPFSSQEPGHAMLTNRVPPARPTAVGLAGFSVDRSGFQKPGTIMHRTASVRHMSRMG